MGIHGLTKAIKGMAPSAIKDVKYEDLGENYRNAVFGVDVYSYLYPSQYNAAAKGKGCHIRTFMELIVTFWSAGVRLLFVFDGHTYSEEKSATIDQRMARRNETNRDMVKLMSKMGGTTVGPSEDQPLIDGAVLVPVDVSAIKQIGERMIAKGMGSRADREELQKILKRNIVITGQNIEDLCALFDLVGATYLQAQGEADYLLASLYEDGVISGVVSEDKDMLTHGIRRLFSGLIDADCRRNGTVREYNLDVLLSEARLSSSQFVDFCILSGCDYCPKLGGVAAGKGLQLVRKYQTMGAIIEAMKGEKITYRPEPPHTIEDFSKSYAKAYYIFTTRQEPSPPSLHIADYQPRETLAAWLLENTNYTRGTVEKKIEQLTSQPEPALLAPAPAPDIKVKVKPQARKLTPLPGPSVKPKIKISVKNVLKTET